MKDNRQIIGISLVLGMIAGSFLGIVFGDEGGKGIGIGIGLGMTLGIVIGAMIVNFKANGREHSVIPFWDMVHLFGHLQNLIIIFIMLGIELFNGTIQKLLEIIHINWMVIVFVV